ncbi:MAG: hypothetical protein H6727_11060 [Myxococcales bacterium]|nr:hypothetical protein [Myxococcales bacterium]
MTHARSKRRKPHTSYISQDQWTYPETVPDHQHPLRRYLRRPPKGFVDLKTFIPDIHLQIRYHTRHNFTGAPLLGYGAPGAWMREKAATALAKVQATLRKQGLSLLVYDAYRPIRGTLSMVAWAKRTKQTHLLKGYIATRSGHNRGHTIDLTICNAKTGKALDMGNAYDTLNPQSHTYNAKGHALKNRLLLLRVMRSVGFRPYTKEWWHFSFRMRARARDVPYGCYEPKERSWRAPKGWDRPGYEMPLQWKPRRCRR